MVSAFATNLLGEHIEIMRWDWKSERTCVVVARGVVRGVGSDGEYAVLLIELHEHGRCDVGMGALPDGALPRGYLTYFRWSDQCGVRVVPRATSSSGGEGPSTKEP